MAAQRSLMREAAVPCVIMLWSARVKRECASRVSSGMP